MKATARKTRAGGADDSWEARLVRRLGIAPWLAGVVVALGVAATYFGPGYGFGLLPIRLETQLSSLPLDPYSWAAIVTSLLAGFTVFALPYAQNRHQADIAGLAPVVPSLDAAGLQQLYLQRVGVGRRLRLGVALAGWFGGILVAAFSVPGALALLTGYRGLWDTPLPPPAYVAAAWFLIVVPVLVASLARASYQMVSGGRQVLRDLEQRITVGPLDADLLRPLASTGLHTAFVWMVGVAIGLLFLVYVDIFPFAIVVLLVVIASFGAIAAVAPSMTGRRILRRAKGAALADVRTAIARAHARCLAPCDPAPASSSRAPARPADDQELIRLGALLAYEQRLETARELPIDTPTVARFALYLAIPLGSWLGAAFVERWLDTALG